MSLTAQDALIHLMVIVSASDRDMADRELARIGAIVRTMPAFASFEHARTLDVAQACQRQLQADDGLEAVIGAVRDALTPDLRETAYALAVDVAAADLAFRPEESRMLDIIRERLGIGRLAAASIESAASIRHRVP